MPTLKEELEEIKTRYVALQEEYGFQQGHIKQLQLQITSLHNQLQQQSEFCASSGDILGHLLWKETRSPDIIESITSGVKLISKQKKIKYMKIFLLLQNRIGDFFSMVVGTLSSFMETYKSEMPAQHSDESQFVMALVGIVTNIAAAANGRHFLMSDDQGKVVVEYFVKMLQQIPIPSGNCLKR